MQCKREVPRWVITCVLARVFWKNQEKSVNKSTKNLGLLHRLANGRQKTRDRKRSLESLVQIKSMKIIVIGVDELLIHNITIFKLISTINKKACYTSFY